MTDDNAELLQSLRASEPKTCGSVTVSRTLRSSQNYQSMECSFSITLPASAEDLLSGKALRVVRNLVDQEFNARLGQDLEEFTTFARNVGR